VEVSSSIEAAVSSRLAACCSVRRDRSLLPARSRRGQGDAGGAGLDLADDLGQLCDGGVGVVAHAREHAVELAVHACGQVAGGDRLQQLRELAEAAVGHLHHAVELLDHHAEIVIEALRVAALAEVAGSGGRGQLLDLRVDGQQAGLGRIHRLVQDRAAAGQAACVRAEVADGVLVEHVDGIADRIEVFEDHRVDAAGQLAIDAREVFRMRWLMSGPACICAISWVCSLKRRSIAVMSAVAASILPASSLLVAWVLTLRSPRATAWMAHGLAQRAGDGAR
jgi:hypothetical protein